MGPPSKLIAPVGENDKVSGSNSSAERSRVSPPGCSTAGDQDTSVGQRGQPGERTGGHHRADRSELQRRRIEDLGHPVPGDKDASIPKPNGRAEHAIG